MRAQTCAVVGLVVAIGSLSAPVVGTQVLQSGDRRGVPSGVIAIRAGRLFDARSSTMLTNQVIVIKADRITDVGTGIQIPPEARVIDLSGATVLPGMIDTHLHVVPQNDWSVPYKTLVGLQHAQQDLNGGFTTIVDLSARGTWATIDIRNAINRGVAKGPRMQVSGPQIDPRARSMLPTPMALDSGPVAEDLFSAGPWAARQAVRKLSQYGADWVKIYASQDFEGDETQTFTPDGKMVNVPSMTLEEIQAIVDEAHRRRMKVSCHTFGGESLHSCLTAAVDKIEHATESDDESIRMLVAKKIPLVITTENMLGTDKSDFPRTGGKVSRLTLTIGTFKKALAAGAWIAFGSDMNNEHGKQQRALAIYVKWGMTPAQALQTTFMGAARALNYGWDRHVGSIEKGKFADLIAVAGDPLTDITEMERVKFVMKGGEVVRNDLAPGALSAASAR